VQQDATGRVHFKVADFGIGAVLAERELAEQARRPTSRGEMLTTGMRGACTVLYASPQQRKRFAPDVRDDVHALGVIWHQLLSGDLTEGPPTGEAWKRRAIAQGMPLGLVDLLVSCCEREPEDRPENAAALATRIADLLPKAAPLDRTPEPTKAQPAEALPSPELRAPQPAPPPNRAPESRQAQHTSARETDMTIPIAETSPSQPPTVSPGLAQPSRASPYEQQIAEAVEQWRTRGDTRAFFQQHGPRHAADWQAAAATGDVNAQWLLARCLQEGAGVAQDSQAAVSLLRKAAESGIAVAQNDLGDCLFEGLGVQEDPAEAYHWYSRAADQGFGEAAKNLGVCYERGKGAMQDDAQALAWFRKAAEQRWAEAQLYVGQYVFNAEGPERDSTEAFRWFRLAAEQGLAQGQVAAGECYLDGDGVKQDELAAVVCFRRAAEQGEADGQYYLGVCYSAGTGVKEDAAEAVRWLQLAAEQDQEDALLALGEAQFILGKCYQEGRGVEKNQTQAEHWYRKAADQGHKKAKTALNRLRKDERDKQKTEASPVARAGGLHCWIYWDPEFAALNVSRGAVFVSADLGSFSVDVGDTLWLVTYRDGELSLTGKMIVGSVENRHGAESLWASRGLWDLQEWPPPFPVPSRAHPDNDFDYAKRRICVFAEAGTEQPFRIVPMGNAVSQLRFRSTGNDQLTMSGGRIVKPQEVVNPRRLTAESGAILQQLWAQAGE
jgi:TPR repeat protein